MRLSFNPRPCARGDPRNVGLIKRFWIVSIHAPARGATSHSARSDGTNSVSIHAPARGATRKATNAVALIVFQSTPLREGRPPTSPRKLRRSSFNPRPCARGDNLDDTGDIVNRFVSIHAPARGATPGHGRLHAAWRVSIHAPARGATNQGARCRRPAQGFNPRPCARGDLDLRLTRSHWTEKFQSTPLREGRRLIPIPLTMLRISFNPRPCARGDKSRRTLSPTCSRFSIHAPARGATSTCVSPDRTGPRSFNPRPCARGDG